MQNTKYNITIANLIAKSAGGSISEEEIAYLNDWLDISVANRILYLRLNENITSEINKRVNKDSKAIMWSKIDKEIMKDYRTNFFLRLHIAASIFVFLAISSFFVFEYSSYKPESENLISQLNSQQAIIINSNGDYFMLNSKMKFQEKNANNDSQISGELSYQSKNEDSKSKLNYNTVIITKGGDLKHILAYGSKVWLNYKSKLKYTASFAGDDLHVFLEREAFFEI